MALKTFFKGNWVLLTLLVSIGIISGGECQLSANFYAKTCPSVESIVRNSIVQSIQKSSIAQQAILRLLFHDCFVEGCDGSILITSSGGMTAERDAAPNLSLAGDGFTAIVEAKARVESVCPGVVSCADILAIAARDAVALAKGPTWTVLTGRRDAKISLASRVQGNLPEANHNVDQLVASFKSKGLDVNDLVALSGAHTLGFAHCSFFANRLYQFNATFEVDPSLNNQYANTLQSTCPLKGVDGNTIQALDPITPFSFDNNYYKSLQVGKGLLTSDEVLWSDLRTKNLVNNFATNQAAFFSAFASSMVKLGNVGVKVGNQGEIRRDCTRFNQ